MYAYFEADNEIDNSSIGNKTTKIYKQNLVYNGGKIVCELEDVLKSGYYKCLSGYEIVDWFMEEVIYLENIMNFYFIITNKGIILAEEIEEDFRNNNICRFCEKEFISDKLKDHWHLTVKVRSAAHNTCNTIVAQK